MRKISVLLAAALILSFSGFSYAQQQETKKAVPAVKKTVVTTNSKKAKTSIPVKKETVKKEAAKCDACTDNSGCTDKEKETGKEKK